MAAALGGGGGGGVGGGDGFDPPYTPRVVVVLDKETTDIRPDTEDNVVRQTDGIFRNFVHQMYDLERLSGEADDTPRHSEITAFRNEPLAYVLQFILVCTCVYFSLYLL